MVLRWWLAYLCFRWFTRVYVVGHLTQWTLQCLSYAVDWGTSRTALCEPDSQTHTHTSSDVLPLKHTCVIIPRAGYENLHIQLQLFVTAIHNKRMYIYLLWLFLSLCAVMDFSARALPIGVKFCTAVWPDLGQVFSYFGGIAPRMAKFWASTRRHMAGYASCWSICYWFLHYFDKKSSGSQSVKTDVTTRRNLMGFRRRLWLSACRDLDLLT